jgi:transcriptional regulator with XRE-family HTH domain/molybdopterin-binding protein
LYAIDRGMSVSTDDPRLLTFGNSTDRLRLMHKPQFGDLLCAARRRKGYSLRDLAELTGMNYSRLSRIEHGTRPAPGLAEIRVLADSLDMEMSDLLVSSGTPREVMGHLLWSERLRSGGLRTPWKAWLPEWSLLLDKNTYRVRVATRDGALCTVALGAETLALFDFGGSSELAISVPPEAVLVARDRPGLQPCTAENVLRARVKKIRHLGQIANLVLGGNGLEINSLHGREIVQGLGLSVGDRVVALVPAAAIRTSPIEEAA